MSDPLYRPVPDGGNWKQNALVGGFESDLTLAYGFWQLADDALANISESPDDSLFIPAMYNARHAIELALKESLRLLNQYLRREQLFESGHPEVALEPSEVENRLAKTHRLAGLLEDVTELLAQVGAEALPEDVVGVVRALHDLDPTGQSFRYSKVKDATKKLVPARQAQQQVNVVELRERLSKTFGLLAWGLAGGELDNMLEMQADYHREANSWGP